MTPKELLLLLVVIIVIRIIIIIIMIIIMRGTLAKGIEKQDPEANI